MRLLYFSILLLSTLVFQISSEVTELDKTIRELKQSLAVLPTDYYFYLCKKLSESLLRDELETFIDELSSITDGIKKEINKVYNSDSLLMVKIRENHYKIQNNLSYFKHLRDFNNKIKDILTVIINESFNTLPKDIQTKLLSIGQDINTSLIKLQVEY